MFLAAHGASGLYGSFLPNDRLHKIQDTLSKFDGNNYPNWLNFERNSTPLHFRLETLIQNGLLLHAYQYEVNRLQSMVKIQRADLDSFKRLFTITIRLS